MGDYHIRKYEDKDYDAARTIVSNVIHEFAPAGVWHVLSCPKTHLLLLGVFLLAYVASVSLLFSLGVVSALLFLGGNRSNAIWFNYVQGALDGDMLDIRGTYLEQKDSCFWVVDNGKEVVGTVAVIQPEEPSLRGRALQLKRMAVKKEHRGRGISKALTKTVIRFAQDCGYKEVMLSTTVVHYVAQQLYESLGFRRVRIWSPSILCKLLNFYIYFYSYEIPGSH